MTEDPRSRALDETPASCFLMRHGDRIQPWPLRDCPLSPEGCQRAAGIRWDCQLAIVSPLLRARQTLDFSGINYTRLKVDPRCREIMSGGEPDYLPRETISIETPEQIATRVEEFRSYLLHKSLKYKSIIVVSHGCFGSLLARVPTLGYCQYVPIPL